MLVKEFHEKTGLSLVAITRKLKRSEENENIKPHQGIKSFQKVGNTYLLDIDEAELQKLIAKLQRRKLVKLSA